MKPATCRRGNTARGLHNGIGAGEGDWLLRIGSDLDIEVLYYMRTGDGFLTAVHGVVVMNGYRGHVPIFNPGSNRNQRSLLRLINPGTETATVTIAGIDDDGDSPGRDAHRAGLWGMVLDTVHQTREACRKWHRWISGIGKSAGLAAGSPVAVRAGDAIEFGAVKVELAEEVAPATDRLRIPRSRRLRWIQFATRNSGAVDRLVTCPPGLAKRLITKSG